MQVKIIEVDVQNMGKYSKAVVAYKDEQGKAATKNVMSFGPSKDAFVTLKSLTIPALVNVDSTKNANGYWDWVQVSPASAAAPQTGEATAKDSATRGSAPAAVRDFESKAERDIKQVYIIRQSCLDRAIDYLTLTGAKKATQVDVVALAEFFKGYVMQGPEAAIDLPWSNDSLPAEPEV